MSRSTFLENVTQNDLYIMHSLGSAEALESILNQQKIASFDYLIKNNIHVENHSTYKIDMDFHLNKFSFFNLVNKNEIHTYSDNYNIIIPFSEVKKKAFNIGYDIADIISLIKEKYKLSKELSIYNISDTKYIDILESFIGKINSYIYSYHKNIHYLKNNLTIESYISQLKKMNIYNDVLFINKSYKEFIYFIDMLLIYISVQVSPEFLEKNNYREHVFNKFQINEIDMGIECRFINYLDISDLNYEILFQNDIEFLKVS